MILFEVSINREDIKHLLEGKAVRTILTPKPEPTVKPHRRASSRLNDEELGIIQQQLDAGMSYREIGDKIGVSGSAIQWWAKKWGVRRK